jgi:hypothetical protein
MKKIFITMTTFVLTATTILAQEEPENPNRTDYREKLLFGFKVGANYSNVYDSNSESFTADAKFGFVTGAFVAIPLGKLIGIQPEVLFSQKGFTSEGPVNGGKLSFSRTTSYLDIPLLLAIKPTEFITIIAGPQYSYLMNQKDVYTYGNTSVSDQTEYSNSNLRKNTLCFTGGFDFTMKHFVVGMRIGWYLQKNDGNGTNTVMTYKNTWYQATIGYRLY